MSWSRSSLGELARRRGDAHAARGLRIPPARRRRPIAFDSIYINAPGAPTFAVELRARARVRPAARKVVDRPSDAQVILDIPLVVDDKDVLSLSPAGACANTRCTKRVQIRLHDNDGNDWLPPGEIVAAPHVLFNETEGLARDAQEKRLLKEMQTDAVQQIVRRLQAAKKPA